ncbi:protein BREAST CANCER SUSCEPTIBILITY 1 [Dorcoceras hygrometricum]|uniref:Protein BREAST CANCER SUSCEPTIBILITY 1 n=1 Tax=Dorcoceras hygrometricum TaxID=472368 RepID=A0A2Z7BG13_9LAMI|nr:protein BREAST CANCER SUSCEPTIBILITY 1 [Dorcoceras hygrometricum]
MRNSQVFPDNYTYVSLFNVCTKLCNFALGSSLHGLIVKTDFTLCDTFLCNVMVDMYGKCGSLESSVSIFNDMVERNVISWTALISALGQHGYANAALEREMKRNGFKPDKVAFLAVFSACRHVGLVREGMALFDEMKSKYHVEPEIDHYLLIVDLLAKHGHLKEAEKLILGMPIPPNALIWRSFLEGCKKQTNIDGLDVAKRSLSNRVERECHHSKRAFKRELCEMVEGVMMKNPPTVCVPKSSQRTAECPSCQQNFTDQEIRPAPYMDNIVAIYKDLDATFRSTLLPMLPAGTIPPISISTSVGQLSKGLGETAPKNKHSVTYSKDVTESTEKIETRGFSKDGACEQFERQFERGLASKADQESQMCRSPVEKNVANFCPVSEELEVNHAPELSPGSSLSDGSDKYAGGCNSDLGSGNGFTEIYVDKSCAGDALAMPFDEVDYGTNPKDTFHERDTKRQKKLHYESSDVVNLSHEYRKDTPSQIDRAAAVSNNLEGKYPEHNSVMSSAVLEADSFRVGSICSFCHSSEITDGSGPMLHYADGKEVARGETTLSKVIPVHSKCIEWAPKVYYVGETIKNLDSELVRAAKLKCSSCGVKGAALGCFAKSCCRSYHVPCAAIIPDCRWDCDDFLMLCPAHKSVKFPSEKSNSRKRNQGETQSLSIHRSIEQSFWAHSRNGPQEWVFCGSALSSDEKSIQWKPNVTHVIAATDEKGACSRTLKVLMAILNGRWVLNVDWLEMCMTANDHIGEEDFEVKLDNHGIRDGPRTGRLRAVNDSPKLFDGLRFYFLGEFVPAYRSDLIALVTDGGGTAWNLERIADPEECCSCLVVYNAQIEPNSALFASDLAKENGGLAIPHTWILESIAEHKLLPYLLC